MQHVSLAFAHNDILRPIGLVMCESDLNSVVNGSGGRDMPAMNICRDLQSKTSHHTPVNRKVIQIRK